MTGFGAALLPWEHGVVHVELRSVNHRFFEVRARAPGAIGDLSAELEETLRKRLERGRIDASIRLESERVDVDRARLGAAIRELAAIRDEFAPGEPLPWALLAADLAASRTAAPTEGLREALVQAAVMAADALETMRRREGEALRAELEKHLALLRADLDAIESVVPELVRQHRTKLHERIQQLLRGAETRIVPERLELEIAIQADRSDVTEELARARTHVALFESLLAGDEAAGRKLDFVTQELLRETNTIGSKVADASVAHRVISLKSTLERLREQVQNVL